MSYEPRSLNPNIMEKRINDLSKASGTGAIPIASAETLGGIKVPADSGMSVDADGAISGVPYSTTEHKTGRKWIDGKDIYEKVVVLENAISVDTSWSNLTISNAEYDKMVHANGLHEDGSFYPLILDLHNSEQATTLYAKSSASVNVKILVFEYTKTTI